MKSVSISPELLDALVASWHQTDPSVENGWVLVGRFVGDLAVVTNIVDAGDKRIAGPERIRFDSAHVSSQVARLTAKRADACILGTLHTHPKGPTLPSGGDHTAVTQWLQAWPHSDWAIVAIGLPQALPPHATRSLCGPKASICWWALTRGEQTFAPVEVCGAGGG